MLVGIRKLSGGKSAVLHGRNSHQISYLAYYNLFNNWRQNQGYLKIKLLKFEFKRHHELSLNAMAFLLELFLL